MGITQAVPAGTIKPGAGTTAVLTGMFKGIITGIGKGTINVKLTKAQLASRKKRWKAKKSEFGSGTLWKYAQTVGPAYLGAPTHPGKKKEVKEYSKI